MPLLKDIMSSLAPKLVAQQLSNYAQHEKERVRSLAFRLLIDDIMLYCSLGENIDTSANGVLRK